MKNSIFKSFRFEIVLYSILSLLYTLLTLAVVNIGIHVILMDSTWDLSGRGGAAAVIINAGAGILLFVAYFLLLTRKFAVFIERIADGINEISKGNLDNKIIIKNEDEFALIADKLNQMAEDIKKLMENERRNEHAKNELITSVAHDLRTPLTSIIGYLDLASSKELTEEVRKKYVEVAYSKSKRLEKLIEDLFTYTKFSFGEVKPRITEVDIVKLMEQLLDEFYPSFAENNLEYIYEASHQSIIIKADGDLLARAFANLIGNAIKYSYSGTSVRLSIDKTEDYVTAAVANTGEVIPEEDLEQIFTRFYRVESSRSSETGGSGLGLAIAQRIIKLHGGSIKAQSSEAGTVFTVTLSNNEKE